jgi:hypothetical protein
MTQQKRIHQCHACHPSSPIPSTRLHSFSSHDLCKSFTLSIHQDIMFSIRSLTFPSSSKLSRLVPQPRLLTTAQPRRTFPQYTVYGSNCMLSLKVVLPTFRATKQKAIYVDSKGLGRVVLEWIPRDSNGMRWMRLCNSVEHFDETLIEYQCSFSSLDLFCLLQF